MKDDFDEVIRAYDKVGDVWRHARSVFSIVILTVLAQCSLSDPPPDPGPQPAESFPAGDWRRQFVGSWSVEFRLDSIRQPGSVEPWQPGSFRTTSGLFDIRDSAPYGWEHAVQSTLEVDFTSLLGRPMSCYQPRPTWTGIGREGDQVRLNFTPTSADCGFSAYGRFFGDSLSGEWDESSFAGPIVMGRFRMIRAR